MVNFATSATLLLTTVSSALAIPHTLQARDVSCLDNLDGDSLANVNEAVECINFLASLGDQGCTGNISGVSFCRRGNTQITGLTPTIPSDQTSTSRCQDVARAAGAILDQCSRGDGKVKGQNPAFGNGDLLVDIRNVPQ
ncbi:hypothetical protein F53441_3719 [Fusarium austroafricanum]|uniref:Hydrophobin n=1 Tax=Fusarium austroafricanum TaxID=2364996 RepID=A0A8H4KP86_9HYPO|nr:hypothetical protein F53441_3719 [Fusarium austroafricanum]